MERNRVIVTVGRKSGCGGHEIGVRVAEALGVSCYDRELLYLAAKEGGFDEKVVANHDEKPTSSFLYSLYMSTVPFNYGGTPAAGDMPLDHRIFLAQFDAIRRIAEKENFVIIGRCGDYALEKHPDVLNVFIHADEEDRIRCIMERESVNESKAREYMNKSDKKRSSYYNYYTNRKWGASENYDLCINSSVFGVEGSVNLILSAIDAMK